MSRRLEEILNELLEMDKTKGKENSKCFELQEPQTSVNSYRLEQGQVRLIDTAHATKKPVQHDDLPTDLRLELQLPLTNFGVLRRLQEFYYAQRHSPYKQLKSDHVFYVEYEEVQGLIRIFLGKKESFRIRGNGTSATFLIEKVFEYQHSFAGSGNDSVESASVCVRTRKPEDFLYGPDRAHGKSIAALISFSIFADSKAGLSSYTIKPEYQRAAQERFAPLRKKA